MERTAPIDRMAVPMVDAHAHIYTLDMPLAKRAWHHPPQDATMERYLRTLDEHGVMFGVLAAASIYGDYNDYQLAATRQHKRLKTTVIVRPDIDIYTLRRMKEDGAVGIRLQWRNVPDTPDLTSPEYRLLFRRIADLDWHVHIHDDGWRLPGPLKALEQAGVKVVVDHFGRATPAEGINCPGFQAVLHAIDNGRTWVKVSAAFRLESPQAPVTYAGELVKHGGADRLFWGSDWPFAAFEDTMSYAQAVEGLTRWVKDPQDRFRVGSENALKFYFS